MRKFNRRALTEVVQLESRVLMSTVTVGNISVSESDNIALFTLSIDSAQTTPTTIAYSTKNGTAKSGKDYTAAKGNAVITAGSLSTSVAVHVINDSLYNGNRTFQLTFNKAPKGVTLGTKAATATIVDDETVPVLTVGDVTVAEPAKGSKPVTVTATLDHGSTLPVSFRFATADDTAINKKDYKAASGTVKFKTGATSATFKLNVTADPATHTDSIFNVNLSSPQTSTLAGSFSRVVIQDNTAGVNRPAATITGGTVVAGTAAALTVTLASAATAPVSIRYSTSGGTASSAQFTPTRGVITIPAGQSSGTISIPTTANSVTAAPVTFNVTLDNPANAALATATATETISTAPATISIANATGLEGSAASPGGLVFFVSLSAAQAAPVSVQYATSVDPNDANHANTGIDFSATSGTLTFNAGETTKIITVPLIGNSTAQPNRDLVLTLSNASGATITTAAATGTIVDDDSGAPRPLQSDFNGDGLPDLLYVNRTSGVVTVQFMNGTTQLGTAPLGNTLADPNHDEIVGTGDFNNDGHPDIVMENNTTGAITIWQQTGAQSLTTAQVISVGTIDPNFKGAGVGDFNNDGTPDILFRNALQGIDADHPNANPNGGVNEVWVMNGFTHASTHTLPTIADNSIKAIGVADFNNDGNLDIYFHDIHGPNEVMTLDGNFNVTHTVQLDASPQPDAETSVVPVAVTNLAGSALPDIVFRDANSTTGANTIWVDGQSANNTALPSFGGIDDQLVGKQVL